LLNVGSIREGYIPADRPRNMQDAGACFAGLLRAPVQQNGDAGEGSAGFLPGAVIPGIMATMRHGRDRTAIQPGSTVDIVRKEDQRTGKRTRGTVREILTRSLSHPHGIKVRLEDGSVGRVAEVLGNDPSAGKG
jgi:uncharacterized repeat protein (TIGR03833 family)